MVLLSPTRALWPAALPGCENVPLLLPRSVAALARDGTARGLSPLVLPDADPIGDAATSFPVRTPGAVIFTSGSTGEAKPVFRAIEPLLSGASTRADVLGLPQGKGCVVGVPLNSGQGVTMMLTALQRGGPLGLLGPVDHRAALSAIAQPEFGCWWATPHFADVLSRCAVTRPPRAPHTCLISTPVSRDLFDAFLRRFGVPLRQAYSSTETGAVAVDAAPDHEVVHGSVGHRLPGVEVRVGDDPGGTTAPGEAGRIWVRSPFAMRGYGIPPNLHAPGLVDGFWPTRDLGRFDDEGRLWLEGRIDDCVRTREGRLLNLATVEAMLRDLPGVRAVAVVSLTGAAGATFGAVIESEGASPGDAPALSLADVPAWARPRAVSVVGALPRLPNGKVDRRACAAHFDAVAV
jgi:acyl-coenzyme A synthetase/AMP-(fatty) acid ligase